MQDYLAVTALRKSFGDLPALRLVSFQVPQGEFLAIAGPNGAGKSTLLRLLGGLNFADGGTIRVNGLDRFDQHVEIKKFTAYLDDQPHILCPWSGRAQLEIVADVYGVPRGEIIGLAQQLIELFHLQDVIDHAPRTFSRGQLRKLSLATAFMSRARLYLFDEPFSGGLDPAGIVALKALLGELSRQPGNTIVCTSQVLDGIAGMLRRVLVLNEGSVVFLGTPGELCERAGVAAGRLELAVATLTRNPSGEDPGELARRLVSSR